MNLLSRIRVIDLMVICAIVVYCGWRSFSHQTPRATTSPFAASVDLGPLNRTAVQADGRLRSFESHAMAYMRYITGGRSINNASKGFTYLDMILRPSAYTDADIIYVKKKPIRASIIAVLTEHELIDDTRAGTLQKSGLFSKTLLRQPVVSSLLAKLGADLIRGSKQVEAIRSAQAVSQPAFLLGELRVLPPTDGAVDSPWISMAELIRANRTPNDAMHAGLEGMGGIPGLDPEIQESVAGTWTSLVEAWRSLDSAEVNVQVARLASIFPSVSPHSYPTSGRLAMESWYYKNKSMTWVWLIYLASVVALLMAVIYNWQKARWIGMGIFVVAFGFHTASIVIRWYISGRWPNANMFEALTTSVWFGGVVAIILERVTRRTGFRNLFALASAVASMAALMAGYFLPTELDSSISNKMAALNDVWLYIHTNVIIASYALIGLAAVTALLYLRHRWCAAWDSCTISKIRLVMVPIAGAILNYTAYLLMMHYVSPVGHRLSQLAYPGVAIICVGTFMMLLWELVGARDRAGSGITRHRSTAAGAGALIIGSSNEQFSAPHQPAGGRVLDGATMVLMELSFILLWTGLVMGAIWADHSWGRPWGWDPKEVFALNTFLIIIALFHVRLKVLDKGLWTAVLAVFGFEVMMFNWIVINFIVTGLHSYA